MPKKRKSLTEFKKKIMGELSDVQESKVSEARREASSKLKGSQQIRKAAVEGAIQRNPDASKATIKKEALKNIRDFKEKVMKSKLSRGAPSFGGGLGGVGKKIKKN